MTLSDRFRLWFAYERDAHQGVLDALTACPAPGGDPRLQRARDLFAHLLAARRLWLHRLGVAAAGPDDLFPTGVSLDRLRETATQVEADWQSYYDRLDQEELDRTFEYQSLEGDRYRNTVLDILTQLFGHSWYHRGQIAALVRESGGEPAVTDYVFWTREAL